VFSQVNGAQAFAREEKIIIDYHLSVYVFERMNGADPL
jgi:hypothetical protein